MLQLYVWLVFFYFLSLSCHSAVFKTSDSLIMDRKTSWFGWRCLFWSPQTRLGMVGGLHKNTSQSEIVRLAMKHVWFCQPDRLWCHTFDTFYPFVRIDFLTQQTTKTFQIQAPALLFHCNSSINQSPGQFKVREMSCNWSKFSYSLQFNTAKVPLSKTIYLHSAENYLCSINLFRINTGNNYMSLTDAAIVCLPVREKHFCCIFIGSGRAQNIWYLK